MKNSFAAITLTMGTLLLAACSSTTPPATNSLQTAPPVAARTLSVNIHNFQFSPQSISIKAGTTVQWMNTDTTTHTVSMDNGAPSSGQIPPGGSYSYTFAKAGTYTYHCSIHPSMTGTVVVQ